MPWICGRSVEIVICWRIRRLVAVIDLTVGVHHPAVAMMRMRWRRRRVPVWVHVVDCLVDGPWRAARRENDAAAARVAAVAAVSARTRRRVAPSDDVPHVETAPGQARQVTAIVKAEVFWVGNVVSQAGVLLVLRVPGGAVLLLASLFPCTYEVREMSQLACWLRVDVLNLRWAIRFWMRRLSSGSVTSVQSSVFLVFVDDVLSFLEVEDEECLDDLEDILCGSFSVSEPD